MIKAIIIDDEKLAIDTLSDRLKAFTDIEIVGTAQKAQTGLKMVSELKPDVLFLDVEMPEMSGLDFLEQMDYTENNCDIVMCTAYDDYMLPSFRSNAFDFLLKPVDPKELEIVIQRLSVNKEKKRKATATGDNVRKQDEENFIFYTNAIDFRLVRIKDIGIFQYNHDLRSWEVIVAGRKEPIKLKRSITNDQILELDRNFGQVNQKYIINIRYLLEVKDNFCKFYPPFDEIDYVKVGRFFRKRFIERFNRL
ncbi:MAG: response regulator [Prevotella sp.]|nr:response regulator [Prevotella sp.]MDE6354163.1 response regulator [Prevotella sp.]